MQEPGRKEDRDSTAIKLQRYQEEIPHLFHTNQILVGLNLFGAKYGAILADRNGFMNGKTTGEQKFPNMADHPSVKEMLELGLIKKEDLSEAQHPRKFCSLVF